MSQVVPLARLMPTPTVDRALTEALRQRLLSVTESPEQPFARARELVCQLGARPLPDGAVSFAFWVPPADLPTNDVPGNACLSPSADAELFVELSLPTEPIDLRAAEQQLALWRWRLPLVRAGELACVVVNGLLAGHRDRLGPLYALTYRDEGGRWRHHLDPLAASIPFGVNAPSEVYDLASLDARRADATYFSETVSAETTARADLRREAPLNILQVHVPTATEQGTLAALAARIRRLGAQVERGEELQPSDMALCAYDALQLLPIEPVVEPEAGQPCWQIEGAEDDEEGEDPQPALMTVHARRPAMTNWGYDVVIAGSAAVNPTLLSSGRPDELVDLAVALHTFPGRPMRLILDVVFGHADNQALALLPAPFFAGANMYGQNLAFDRPMVRALLLEMQRRKVDLAGADGLRVDGAQDFKVWDADRGELRYDDDYLREMSAVEARVAGARYWPWMIFEDGRPWPAADWELSSTYRAVTEDQPHAFQWGPLTFAHNTPFLQTFWAQKHWRTREITRYGERWITGVANHDTLRRGAQVSPDARRNERLGGTARQALFNGYDNPAGELLTHGFLPGVPMGFLNASLHSPWAFIRNTDDRYALKVACEERRVFDWFVDDGRWDDQRSFGRLKAAGFVSLERWRRFLAALAAAVELSGDDPPAVFAMLAATLTGPDQLPLRRPEELRPLARAMMDDLHAYCNVTHRVDEGELHNAPFALAARRFRRSHPWLARALLASDVFELRWPCAGAVVLGGYRRGPHGEELLFCANMEGAAVRVDPIELVQLPLRREGWRPLLVTPGVQLDVGVGGPTGQGDALHGAVTLADSRGVIFGRVPPMS
jgi:hypothetical protein